MTVDEVPPIDAQSGPHASVLPLAVDLRDVHKSFGTVQAIRGINLQIRAGEVMAYLGPNGAGKTSTIDIILGLSRPTSGKVTVYGMTPRQAITKGLISAVMQTGGLAQGPHRRGDRVLRLQAVRREPAGS